MNVHRMKTLAIKLAAKNVQPFWINVAHTQKLEIVDGRVPIRGAWVLAIDLSTRDSLVYEDKTYTVLEIQRGEG